MPHIAMVSIPFPGHVNPSIEVVRELVARGHRVTYANDPSWATAIEATGAEMRPYRSALPAGDDWGGDMIDHLTLFLDDAIAMLPQLRDAYADDRPDLFLYDIAGAPARLLAEQWGIPSMQVSPTFVAWDGYEQELTPMIEQMRADPRGAAYYDRFERWLTAEKSSVTDSAAFQGRPDRGLVLIPRAMQPHAERVDESVFRFAGPILGDRADQGDWARPAEADGVLLVSLGSTFTDHPEFYRRCVEAFGDLPGWHTVLQIGRHVDEAALGPVPATVEVHRWVPQLRILRQADAFLTHGGMGGSVEGLYCGTPMLVAPQAADQFGNADRLVELGVARRVGTDVSAQRLRETFLQLIGDPEVHRASAAVSRELRDSSGAEYAATLIENAAA
ncbi:macrolide-inactivating glycosyltransferase [Actinoplanes philippinensis]|uniref:Glycosyltransferase, MGT family n=1 Tax=Actinoplanes philippinensis TaxID=35752 RepID=A0A1I2HEG6_9ACTN|nr:macrolide family glycosyltransferase [Actinoplanes philippinensis]GIE81630.1 macrolide-inactivating glycosyltransferase [Actinoplanes philippinensis]SFF27126.1 glycosyltransferase, MGT family [Actinoplanes philippinensis]